MADYAGTPAWNATVACPADGQARAAAQLLPAIHEALDRNAYLRDRNVQAIVRWYFDNGVVQFNAYTTDAFAKAANGGVPDNGGVASFDDARVGDVITVEFSGTAALADNAGHGAIGELKLVANDDLSGEVDVAGARLLINAPDDQYVPVSLCGAHTVADTGGTDITLLGKMSSVASGQSLRLLGACSLVATLWRNPNP
jgi:hypothetical protein